MLLLHQRSYFEFKAEKKCIYRSRYAFVEPISCMRSHTTENSINSIIVPKSNRSPSHRTRVPTSNTHKQQHTHSSCSSPAAAIMVHLRLQARLVGSPRVFVNLLQVIDKMGGHECLLVAARNEWLFHVAADHSSALQSAQAFASVNTVNFNFYMVL
jgi:hypothetical protein